MAAVATKVGGFEIATQNLSFALLRLQIVIDLVNFELELVSYILGSSGNVPD